MYSIISQPNYYVLFRNFKIELEITIISQQQRHDCRNNISKNSAIGIFCFHHITSSNLLKDILDLREPAKKDENDDEVWVAAAEGSRALSTSSWLNNFPSPKHGTNTFLRILRLIMSH